MKHVIYASFALCLALSGCADPAQDNRLIIISPITGEKLEVAPQDLDPMKWEDAKKACANLGNGWRLPTKDELEAMYKELHLKGKGNFNTDPNSRQLLFDYGSCYWSGTEDGYGSAWYFEFGVGEAKSNFYASKDYTYYVRAVRALD